MLEKAKIEKVVSDAIQNTDSFVVEIKTSTDNKIFVYVDHPEGVSIDECARISRYIESKFDREQEDFELQVSSPGIDKPFKVIDQYKKNIGQEVRVTQKNGTTFEGKITKVDQKKIILEWTETYKKPGEKKKQTSIIKEEINIDAIASAKRIVSF